MESLAIIVACFVFAGLAWGLFVSHPTLRIVCLIALIGSTAVLLAALAKNPPWLVLADNALNLRCYPLGPKGEVGKVKQMVAPLEYLDRIWVGRARDYPSGLLMNHPDPKSFPRAKVMVIWLRNESDPYLMREFSWLSTTEDLLERLQEYGIRVERVF